MTTELDRSYWETDDKAWMAERKANWKLIDKWYTETGRMSSDCPMRDRRKALKNYYCSGLVDPKHSYWLDLAALHPNLTPEAFEEVLDVADFNRYIGLCIFHLTTSLQFNELMQQGLVSESIIMLIAERLGGQNYTEMSKILAFDPYEQVSIAVRHRLFDSIQAYMTNPPENDLPRDCRLAFFKSILSYVDDKKVKELEGELNLFFNGFARRLTSGNIDTPEKQAFTEELKAFFISGEVHACIRDLARQYIDYD